MNKPGKLAAMTKANELLRHNIDRATAVFASLAPFATPVEKAGNLIADSLLAGGKLLACGNGGSGADAAHMTTEFVCRFTQDRKPFGAICLNAHGGDLTAIGNDYAFVQVFERQVQAYGARGDVLVALTTSGRSENVRLALAAAKTMGVHTIALLGKDGGDTTGIADVELIVPDNETARIQEAHQLLIHTMCQVADQRLCEA